MIFNESRSEIKIRRLESPKLRRVRYEIRTLLYLIYQKKLSDLRKEYTTCESERDCSLILREKESIRLTYHRHSISCYFCGNRMDDLFQDPSSLFWFCSSHLP